MTRLDDMILATKIRGEKAVDRFFHEENGDTNFISMLKEKLNMGCNKKEYEAWNRKGKALRSGVVKLKAPIREKTQQDE